MKKAILNENANLAIPPNKAIAEVISAATKNFEVTFLDSESLKYYDGGPIKIDIFNFSTTKTSFLLTPDSLEQILLIPGGPKTQYYRSLDL